MRVEWQLDEYYFPDYLGTFETIWKPYSINRQTGVLYGENQGDILAENLYTGYWDDRQKRYFCLGSNHLPFKYEHWKHVDPDTIRKILREHKTLRNQEIAYAIQDWHLAEGYGIDWHSYICLVRDEHGHILASLGGIDNPDAAYREQIEKDLLEEAHHAQ